MKSNQTNKGEGLFKSIVLAYTILVLHLLLLVGMGLLVIFFGGLVQYLVWIFIGGMVLIGASAYWFYRRLRQQGRTLSEALRAPMFHGRAVEISFLGGMAALKLGPPQKQKSLEAGTFNQTPLLEDPDTSHVRDLAALAQLLEKNLITQDEFQAAKQKFLGS